MPWSNQSGGGSGGGGGPWKPTPGPWGSGPQNSGGGGSPDLEELLRRGQDRLKNVLPGGGGSNAKWLAILVPAALVLWGLSGIYTVQTSEVGVVMRFGKYAYNTTPGLNYHLPYPIETVYTPNVTERRRVDVGLRITEDPRRTVGMQTVTSESLMLTGDENIVDINFSVFWRINDAPNYLFKIQNPEGSIRAVAESAMREVVGRSELTPILTGARQTTEVAVQQLMQEALNSYEAGVTIEQVQMQKVDPPQEVIAAFRDVQAARADQERLQNEAFAYANRVVPEARGDAARIVQAAEAYREQVVAEARGQSSRFTQIRDEYTKAPDVTRQRMFLETMERLYGSMDKTIIDSSVGEGGVVPYLPLDQLRGRAGQNAGGGR